MKTYDVIVVGAGIAGCSSAYFLKKKGLEVLVVDRAGVAVAGGSAAAGAFVSPKIGKGSLLQTLTNEAFEFAKDFYLNHFPQHFQQTGVLRIPKDEEDAQKFVEYDAYNHSKRVWFEEKQLEEIGIKKPFKALFFQEAGVCDAPALCEALLEGIEYVQDDVKSLTYTNKNWKIGDYCAKKLVLATGYENRFFDMRYMGIKGTWGSRGDYESRLPLKLSMHKKISISANIDGTIKVGATHEKGGVPCAKCTQDPLFELFKTASTMVDTSDFKLKKIHCGMRSGSKDYFPLVGRVIDVPTMLKEYPKLLKGAKLKEEPKRLESLYVCNGLGGRGFVFGPLMGKMLAENIVNSVEIDKRVNPDRLFLKWCRKSPELERYR